MTQGRKRASPGADAVKPGSSTVVELSEADSGKLKAISKTLERLELAVELYSQEKHAPVWEQRREVLKNIPHFWPRALMNHSMFAMHAVHTQDQDALEYVEDVWITRNPEDKRCFTIEFYFKENPFFSDSVLKKEFKYSPPAAPLADEQPDENGITASMCEFAWDTHVAPQATEIHWKDDSKNLTKLHPQLFDEVDDLPSEAGSFFNFFEKENDPYDLGIMIANEAFPEAIDAFFGRNHHGDDDSELDESDEDEDNEEEDEIDLEKPRAKKQRT